MVYCYVVSEWEKNGFAFFDNRPKSFSSSFWVWRIRKKTWKTKVVFFFLFRIYKICMHKNTFIFIYMFVSISCRSFRSLPGFSEKVLFIALYSTLSLFRNKRFMLDKMTAKCFFWIISTKWQTKKNYMDFHIPKTWQILKHFARSFHQA